MSSFHFKVWFFIAPTQILATSAVFLAWMLGVGNPSMILPMVGFQAILSAIAILVALGFLLYSRGIRVRLKLPAFRE